MPPTNHQLNPLDACNPTLNATVSASAGSGKTWLLITRIVRLLLAGAEPGNIIALTFTRKAAAEMQIRLNQRLFEMATADDAELASLFDMIDCTNDEQHRNIARGLYEKLLHSLYPIRIQTFHSFCQDILSRFPLEADIPPGFDLLEDSSLLQRQAWQLLFDEARQHSLSGTTATRQNRSLNDSLDCIMQFCNGPDNTLTALRSFLSHRSDWWAFTATAQNPVAYASTVLSKSLLIEPQYLEEGTTPEASFFDDIIEQKLRVFANLLREINLKTSNQHADIIDTALELDDTQRCFTTIKSAFLIKSGEKMVQGRKHTNAMEKKLGAENTERFLSLHHEISGRIQDIEEQIKRLQILAINKAWYFAGNRYVEIFQQLKTQMRQLDFTDLEWKCYQLLQTADNAHWVQYKIDQRIDHLLIDEFQDTNPTQWHLLSPILEEVAANPEERQRSVFLVGDEKQSIYSFRRANPALQAQASEWLAEFLAAQATPLDFSRRSSPAIIDCVNRIFQQASVASIMPGFTKHGTHLDNLPGQVVLCDLFEQDEANDEDIEAATPVFRNPLLKPREVSQRTLRHDEADYIAQQIRRLVDNRELITGSAAVRAIDYGDILILLRNRTHIGLYEAALKQYGIPFIGSKKGGLLDNLEIQDLCCLLNTLITPFDNLALAQVLKSPIFDASDDDLITLARYNHKSARHWYQRLLSLHADSRGDNNRDDSARSKSSLSKALKRAATLLPRWQTLAEQLPVHDCLDRIFSEGNIIKRYIAASRAEDKQRVAASCQRFLELSLETDSGRYPGISRFLQNLEHLKKFSDSPPEEPLSQSDESRVRLMTIHGSKGLEAPVVFLADCNSTATNRNAYASLVRWPAEKPRPVNFQLQLNKDSTDSITARLQQARLDEQAREDLNLLYVALTRARERLFISGVASRSKQNNSWYQVISEGLADITASDTGIEGISGKRYQYLDYENSTQNTSTSDHNKDADKVPPTIDKHLLQSLTTPFIELPANVFLIAPSSQADGVISNNEMEYKTTDNTSYLAEPAAETARLRGTVIHRSLEQLCDAGEYPAIDDTVDKIKQRLHTDLSSSSPGFVDQLDDCIQEAVTTYNHPALATVFKPTGAAETYNEMPLMYMDNEKPVYGIIDRVIKTDDIVFVIDYKSHLLNELSESELVAAEFSKQLAYYRRGVEKLWPETKVHTGIVFTHNQQLVWLNQ